MTSKFDLDLDYELFQLRNAAQAYSVALTVLALYDQHAQARVLARIEVEYVWPPFKRFLFESMEEMIEAQGFVDLERLRQGLVVFASSGSPEFVKGCLANFDQILSLRPTPDHLERALQIIEDNRAEKKSLRIVDPIQALCGSWREQDLPAFEQWLSSLEWSERDVKELSKYISDRGERVVLRWVKLGRLEPDRAPEVAEILRAMRAF